MWGMQNSSPKAGGTQTGILQVLSLTKGSSRTDKKQIWILQVTFLSCWLHWSFQAAEGYQAPPPSPQVCVYSKGRLGPLVSTDLYPGERDQDVTLVTAEVTLQSEIRNLGGLVGCTCTLSQQERQKQAPTAYHWVLIVYSAKSYKA